MSRSALVLLAVVALGVGSLVVGGDTLERLLPGGVPLGTALAAVALVAAALVPRVLSRAGTRLRAASGVAVSVAVAWYPVSIAMAGNLALVFSGDRGRPWLAFTVAAAVLILATLAWALTASLRRLRRGGPAPV